MCIRDSHLVLLASMREQALDSALDSPVDNTEDALHKAATQHYLRTREATLERIRAAGIRCLDVTPNACLLYTSRCV